MSEPEDVLTDAARHAVVAARKLWDKRQESVVREEGLLSTHRRRLELLVAAACDREIRIFTAQPPAPRSLLDRWFGTPSFLENPAALPETDGVQIFLPAELEGFDDLPPERLFRSLALQQAVRVIRGSAHRAPSDPLAHELYVISEAEAADRHIVRELPGLRADLAALREGLRRVRPATSRHRPIEEEVESLYFELLAAGLDDPSPIPLAQDPGASRRWAEERAEALRADHDAPFRGLLRDLFLGSTGRQRSALRRARPLQQAAEEGEARKAQSAELRRRPRVREAEEDEDDEEVGPWMIAADPGDEHAEDPMGMQRPTDRGTGDDTEGAADLLSDLEEARVVSSPEKAKEIAVGDEGPAIQGQASPGEGIGISYPEWDYRVGAYDPQGATVRLLSRPLGPPSWAQEVLQRRAKELEVIRKRFEGLRPRRERLSRQSDGDELDLEAWVEARADLAAGVTADDRLYQTTRPRRRDLALHLLIDASASTDAWVTEELRIIDVEKEALLICVHALQALGDPYAIHAFSGEGPHGVRIWSLKDFEEHDLGIAERRIASLEPDEYTRAGAAIRHATAALAARKEQHRLLLVISDGKPNDQDHYGGPYGIEDMRQAVAEAQGAGLHCFCLTVDRDAPTYIHRIFGYAGYSTLRHARELPFALAEVLRQLIRR